ncbi:multiple epidermal growth factor-like domains protein 10 [Haliotis rufescens]|uniref:multiple epidermal growth factor-like domains protein 10 n=1 Tax=Haliotis rufescens TaxID=6454 RepID=UPI00201F00B3|nr:multiple epidermal growth factor-like domains protein 10 [Haliotis rufescens]
MEGHRLGVLLWICVCVLDGVAGSCPDGTYGYQCGYRCNCLVASCDTSDGCKSQSCNTGWSGPTCQQYNKALNKPTSASTAFRPPNNAVNGNTRADYSLLCFHSAFNDNFITSVWWRVDLGERTAIHDVTIYFRKDLRVRRNGIRIYIADTDASPTDGVNCYYVTGNRHGTDIPDVLRVSCPGKGRYLVLYTATVNNEPDGYTMPIMDFCEVEVDVCSPGTFGANCDKYCHCVEEVCDHVSGVCPGGVCRPGWATETCETVCYDGQYGANCSNSCQKRNCKGDNSSCNHVTGECIGGCGVGWNGADCSHKCLQSYGDGCSEMCSDRKCNEASRDNCDHVTGECESGCRPGWKDTDCTEACVPGVEYGADCVGDCSARMCKGNFGTCPGDTGRCESGCQPGWRGEDCAQVCSPGTFGTDCDNSCHCEGEACDYVSGVCPGGVCLPGWETETCETVCYDGQYGANCSNSCLNRNCKGDNSSCDHVTGECVRGCMARWNGIDCTQKMPVPDTTTPTGGQLSPTTTGIIGVAVGTGLTVILGIVLHVCLVRQGRLMWIGTSQKDEVRDSQGPVDKNITQASDYTSVSEVAHDDGCSIGNNNYIAVDVATKADSDIIEDQIYEEI